MSITTTDADVNQCGVKFNAATDIVFSGESSTEPVTLQEAKDWMKLGTGTAEDALVTALIKTARMQCEQFLNISLITRTVTAVLNNTIGGIFLPYGPVGVITSITTFDGTVLVAADDDYKISGTQFKQLLLPKYNRLTAVYAAGYATLPEEFKTAIKEQVFYLYINRGEVSHNDRQGTVTSLTLSPMAKTILRPLRRV